MSKKNITKKSHKVGTKWLYILLCLFVGIGILLAATWYRYQINPDGTSYISIAEKYAHFDIRHAVNGYWGPLYSILMVPFLWMHIEPIIAAKVVSLLAGAGVLYCLYYILRNETNTGEKLGLLVVLGLAPTLLVWIMPGPITPDVLMVLSLLIEIVLLLRYLRIPTPQNTALLAAGGLLLYVTKYVGFYFFVCQVTLVLALRTLINKDFRNATISWAKLMIVFAAFTLPVLLTLSLKYHHLTISTAGGYNHGILAPQYNGTAIHPTVITGPFTPPNTTAYSAWEDPTNLPVPQWSALSSVANLKYFLSELIYHNINVARDAIISFGVVTAVGFVVMMARLITSVKKFSVLDTTLGITALTLIAAYLPLTTEPRYLFALAPLSLIALVAFLCSIKFSASSLYVPGVIFVALCIWTSAQTLNANRNVLADFHSEAVRISQHVPPHSKVTSDVFSTVYTCMFDNLQCYGLIHPSGDSVSDKQLYNNLKRQGVKYYIDYGSAKSPQLSNFINTYTVKDATISQNTIIYRYK